MNADQATQMTTGKGFIAALDQSGGSTPKALGLYGLDESNWTNDEEMFDLVHQMRSRIMTSPAFNGDRVIAAILFEMTMDRQVEGKDTADYLWSEKRVVPFLKIDKGLATEENGVQLMKPMPDLDALLERGVAKGIFGTKERSVINSADEAGIQAIADQQFEVGKQVLSHGLMPILEPEVNIKSADKEQSEALLKAALLKGLEDLPEGQQVMFKLSLPTVDGFYSELISHPKVMRVVALSGGYTRDEANEKLAKNPGMIASFSRALAEGLTAQMSDEEFNSTLDHSIQSIYDASIA